MNSTQVEVMTQIRAVRSEYDQGLSPGDRAVLRRCREPGELLLEGAFWRVASRFGDERARPRLAVVVFLFAACDAARPDGKGFGRFLHRHLTRGKKLSPGAKLRFRRLIAAPDVDALATRLRRLLVSLQAPLDWGVLGYDLMQWQRSTVGAEEVPRRWAQDFYAPLYESTSKAPTGAATDSKETEG
jgi:CRISPR type I-E-associated protein CasB/Cse2